MNINVDMRRVRIESLSDFSLSGVHKGGFSKGGFSNNNIIVTHKLLNPPLLNFVIYIYICNDINITCYIYI